MEQKLKAVNFGNLIRHDTFITHYIIDDDPLNGWYGTPEMMDFYLGKGGNGEEKRKKKEKQTIYVDFEHDRRRLFIMFPVLWPNTLNAQQTDNEVKKRRCIAKLNIDYNSIRRIFCTVSI